MDVNAVMAPVLVEAPQQGARSRDKKSWDQLNSSDLDNPENRREVNEYIVNLIKAITSNDGACTVSPSCGATDITLLVARTEADRRTNFVLKLSPEFDPINAKMNGKILQLLGFSVPNLFISRTGDSSHGVLWKYTQRNGTKKRNITKPGSNLVFMQAFPGINLGQLIGSGDVFKLRRTQWVSILENFGRLAIVDLAIGNHDRFFVHVHLPPSSGGEIYGVSTLALRI